jgi:diamine N-acetyltransferase
MKLNGKNITLRALEPSDVELLYKWENDPLIWKVSDTLTPYSLHVLEQYIISSAQDIYSARQLRLMIQKNTSGPAVGAVDLFDFDPKHLRAGIGIMIADENERRSGHASEAIELLIPYCFEVLHLNQLYCNVAKDNEASIKLFMKFGFEITGIKKQWMRSAEGFTDEFLLQLMRK